MKGGGPLAFLFYLAIRSVFALMQCFPLEWNLVTARLLARIWPVVMPRHRQRALANLSASLGRAYTAAGLSKLADRSLESVAMFAVEAVCLPRRIQRTSWNRRIRLRGFDGALEVLLRGEGAILVTGHYGSFEILGHLLAAMGFPISAVMRPLDNVYLNRFVVASRRVNGLELLDKKGAGAIAESLLSSGGLVGFIGDQDAGSKGLFVDFFGRPASTYKSIGLLAISSAVPIIVGYARRLGNTATYEVGVERIIEPGEWQVQAHPLMWITTAYTEAIERFVREEPGQYLWIHRRWKSKPRQRQACGGEPLEPTPYDVRAAKAAARRRPL